MDSYRKIVVYLRILIAGFLILDAGSWMLDAGLSYGQMASSTNYRLQSAVANEGGPGGTSENYSLNNAVGLGVVASVSSESFNVVAGHQPTTNIIPLATLLNFDDGKYYTETRTPALKWSYIDKEDQSQRYYQVQISRDDFASALIDSGIVTSENVVYTSTILPWLAQPPYKWRVRVHDGFDWSGWITGTSGFRLLAGAELDITVVYASASSGGLDIDAESWQGATGPYFWWEPPASGLELRGYSFALDDLPDEEIDTSGTSHQFPVGTLTDGKHTFYVAASNLSGQWGAPGTFSIWVDTTAPSVLGANPTSGSLISNDRTPVRVNLFEAQSGIDSESCSMKINRASVSFDFDESQQVIAYTPGTPLSEGTITVSFQAQDMAGNASSPYIWSFVVDTMPPTGSIVINRDDEVTNSVYVNLILPAEDATTEIKEMMLSNNPTFAHAYWESYSAEKKGWKLPLVSGKRVIYVKFRDEAGNESVAYRDDIKLIIVAPDTFITAGPSGITTATTAYFGFKASSPECLFKWKLDDRNWSEWSDDTTVLLEGLSEGNHYFLVKAGKDVDESGAIEPGEEDPNPAQRSWTVRKELIPVLPPEVPTKYWRRE